MVLSEVRIGVRDYYAFESPHKDSNTGVGVCAQALPPPPQLSA